MPKRFYIYSGCLVHSSQTVTAAQAYFMALVSLVHTYPDSPLLTLSTGLMAAFGNASKAYLFLIRVRAVFGNSHLATFCVAFGGLVVAGTRMGGVFRVHTAVSQVHQSTLSGILAHAWNFVTVRGGWPLQRH